MESETIEEDGSGLEAKVAENAENRQTDERVAEESGATLKYSSKKAKGDEDGNRIQYEINLLERMLALNSASSEDSSEDEDSPHGSVTFVYHKDKKTGKTEYLVEQPQLGKSEAGKIKLIGGHRKVRESHDEAIRRETGEEVSSPAKEILLGGDFVYHTTMTDTINGKILQTAIYKREIKSDTEWQIVKAAYGIHDAGNLRTFTDRVLLNTDNQYFAYGNNWAKMFKDFVRETSGLDHIVSKSFVPIASKHSLQMLNYSSA